MGSGKSISNIVKIFFRYSIFRSYLWYLSYQYLINPVTVDINYLDGISGVFYFITYLRDLVDFAENKTGNC